MMHYWMGVLCCLLSISGFAEEKEQEHLILSTPDQLATLTSERSYLIGGIISPMSGHPSMSHTDLVVKGAQDIALTRIYIPPHMPCFFPAHENQQEEYDKVYLHNILVANYKGWQFFPHLKLQFYPGSMQVRLSEPNGATLEFGISGSQATLASPPYAMNNTTGGEPNGKYELRNTRISYEDNKIIVYAADGAIRFYDKTDARRHPYFLYLLQKEVLPNGRVLKYHYQNYQPILVESWDPQERFVYASLRISGSPEEGTCHFTSSTELTADYGYENRPMHATIKEKIKKGHSKKYFPLVAPPMLISVSSPFFRYEGLGYCRRHLLTTYTAKDHIFTAFHSGFGDGPHYRVLKLSLPDGPKDEFQSIYEMDYHPAVAGQKEGSTLVKNSDGTSIVYHFSKNLLTTLIQYFGQDGGLKKEKVFSWTDNQWLKSIEMRDSEQIPLYKKSYDYDRFGNPTLEVFAGDLTGEGNLETFTTKRTFSEDGRNLLLREEGEDGKVICISYLPNTNLVTSRLTKDGDKIILREFSVYDDCHNLIQKIADDGASEDRNDLANVTQRNLTTCTLRQSAPFLHMPEWIVHTYLEDGIEKPLKKSHLNYDRHGNVDREEVYDAQGVHAYTLCRTYNECGDVLTETNRLGQEAIYTYDTRGRPEASTHFSGRIHTTFRRDAKGRLRELTEKGDDDVTHVSSSDYDFHDRLIHKRDPFNNSTHYTYDPLVSQVAKTDFPLIASEDGLPVAVSTLSSYDPFGRELTRTDPNGNITTYRYNAYGVQTEILHPGGGKEQFRYAKNGMLSSHTDPDGLTIHYKNDVLGRVLSKTYFSADATSLAVESFTYNGFNLLTETDKEGHVKLYAYDGAGRKIREEFCDRVTEFSYDSLGWLATIHKHNADHPLFTHYGRDLEGRILEERKTDASGNTLYKINYSYDVAGNQKTVTRSINKIEAVETFYHDSFSRLTCHQDAEGYFSKTTYDENFTNSLGQRVLQTTTIGPRRMTTIETQDALTRTIRTEVLNPLQATISCQDMTYDSQGNLLYRRDHVYENDRFQNTQTVKYTYTPDHQMESLTRAFGTPDARTTTYTYYPSGKLSTKTLPDGVTLFYTYHPLGNMARLDSSDDKIHHVFEYDKLGYLRYASDENQKIAIKRQVDPFGNVTQEVFPCGLEVTKDYDDIHRLICLKMANQGEVLYTYDPLFLRRVTRVSPGEEILYAHTYDEYDWDGNLVTENLVGKLGRVDHVIDRRGYKASISSPWFSQQCGYDGVGNLINNSVDGVQHRYSYDGLSQLSSENSAIRSLAYTHDSLYNRIQKNEKNQGFNDLNELLSENALPLFDLNGNQILKQTPSETNRFTYDPLNRLIEISSEKKKVNFVYDPLGRRLSKIAYTPTALGWKETDREHYLYHGQNEIGAFSSAEEPKNLRILGVSPQKNSPNTVSVELDGHFFAPILDVQGNILRLVNPASRAVTSSYEFTAFGQELQKNLKENAFNPWRFASKRFDPELGLIYFGKRYYDPEFARWLTTDPAGFVDSVNLYQYVLNNPFRYCDPRGDSLGGYLLGLGEIVLGGTIMAGGLALEVVTIGGFTFGLGVTTSTGAALIGLGLATTTYHAQDIKAPNISWKNTDVYAPDRPLPRDPRTQEPVPETDVPHTELGTKKGTKGTYPQAREFDAQGRPVKDIDFTDHGRPQDHPDNPHEHEWKPNPTGGTPQRSSEAKPLTK